MCHPAMQSGTFYTFLANFYKPLAPAPVNFFSAIVPFTTSFITEAILSGAFSGTVITTPSPVFATVNFLAPATNVADTTGCCNPGTTTFLSAGQLNTLRYKIVLLLC